VVVVVVVAGVVGVLVGVVPVVELVELVELVVVVVPQQRVVVDVVVVGHSMSQTSSLRPWLLLK
jgi:hypothetical protein